MELGVSGSFKWTVVKRKAFKSPSVGDSVYDLRTLMQPLICLRGKKIKAGIRKRRKRRKKKKKRKGGLTLMGDFFMKAPLA
jgi:hypothetical protein